MASPTMPTPFQQQLGPQTRQQWIAMMTQSLVVRFINGEDMTENQVSDAWMQSHGFNLDALHAAFGRGAGDPNAAVDPVVWMAMSAAAGDLYSQSGLNLPDEPGSATDPNSQAAVNATSAANNAATNATSVANTAANNQNAIDVANINGQTSRDVAGINADSAREVANIRAGVDRETIASNERIASADRESRERIATADRIESARQFDLGLAEDRRQFNVSLLSDLLKTGAQLAANPVDWVAHQFFMSNMNIPLTALNIGASAMLFGALPPSGPSAAGPVIGGPGAMDGDLTLAQQVGATNPGFVSVTEAAQVFPGAGDQFGAGQYTSAVTVPRMAAQVGGPQQLDRMVDQGRVAELPQAVGTNPVTEKAVVESQRRMAMPIAPQPLTRGPQPAMPGQPSPLPDMGPRTPKVRPETPFGARPMVTPRGVQPETQPGSVVGNGEGTSMGGEGRGIFTGATATPPGTQVFTGATGGNGQPEWQVIPEGGTGPVPGGTSFWARETTGATGGNGQPEWQVLPDGAAGPLPPGQVPGGTTPAPTNGTGAQAPQGEQLLAALSNQTGIPIEQLRQLVPTNLLAGGYSPEVIAQMPVIQAIRNQSILPVFRTDPVAAGQRFGQIEAFGVPLGNGDVGFRGGQDMNAGTYLKANASDQGMIEGAVRATGQYWPDVMEQSLRVSPVTNYEPGGFGRRRF